MMAAVQQQTTQLEFHQAMSDFKTMFPDMDDDVIEAVLRANQGAVDTTIDQLLAMSTDNENERLRKEMERQDETKQSVPLPLLAGAEKKVTLPISPTKSAAGRASEPDKVVITSPQKSSPKGQSSMRVICGWSPPLLGPLPRDFLRIASPRRKTRENMVLSHQFLQQKYAENKQKRGALGDLNDPDLSRFLEDERIALFLQNEEFMQELRRNKDFMTSLEKDSRRRRPAYWSSSSEDSDSDSDEQAESLDSPPEEVVGAFPFTRNTAHDDDALFKEKLKNMGKMSRKKFAQLAGMFTRRKKRSAKQILSQGPAPSKDNLLLSAEPILVEEDEVEDSEEKVDFTPEGPPSNLSNLKGATSKLEGL